MDIYPAKHLRVDEKAPPIFTQPPTPSLVLDRSFLCRPILEPGLGFTGHLDQPLCLLGLPLQAFEQAIDDTQSRRSHTQPLSLPERLSNNVLKLGVVSLNKEEESHN